MSGAPALSVVVVAFDMRRELPRTLFSLSPQYQLGVEPGQYEVLVVDNGSPTPVDPGLLRGFPGRLRSLRLDDAAPSPAAAANVGLREARGDLVGLMIDGARVASPGLLAHALLAARLATRPVIACPAWHLGPVLHSRADAAGYDRDCEDALLAESGWEVDGYQLFTISTLAASSDGGWFLPMGECNALFMTREMWSDLGGLDERFTMPGGGLANHDVYRRACALPDARLVMLLGEGTFHQIHGGAATSRRDYRAEAGVEYETLRAEPYARPANAPLFVGTVPPQALTHLEASARKALDRDRHARRADPESRPEG